jgi:hypothetical protein
MYILFVAAPIVCFLLWLRFGRDEKPVETVEFYPPEGLTPSEIGYLLDGKVQAHDMLSMILWWASQKLLVIEESSRGEFLLRRICALPAGRKPFEKTLWNALFFESECVDLREPNIEFSIALNQAKRELINGYKKDVRTNLYTRVSMQATIACALITLVPLIAFIVHTALINASTMSYGKGTDMEEILGYSAGVAAFCSFILYGAGHRKRLSLGMVSKDGSASMQLNANLNFLIPFVIMVVIGIIGSVILDLPNMMMATASVAICIFFTVNVRQRTDYYKRILGSILGFKNFIKVAKADQMKELFADDPQYYFKILPFAWIFGLSNIWADRFENIIMESPDWYMGYYENDQFTSYMFVGSLDRLQNISPGIFQHRWGRKRGAV